MMMLMMMRGKAFIIDQCVSVALLPPCLGSSSMANGT